MTNHDKNNASIQGDLFQQLSQDPFDTETSHDMDIGPELMGVFSAAIREAKKRGLSREKIVDRMNQCLPEMDKAITLRQLNSWTAASKEFHEFPTRYLPAFCWATNSILPVLLLAHNINHDLVDRRERYALELGQKTIEQARIAREVKSLKHVLEV